MLSMFRQIFNGQSNGSEPTVPQAEGASQDYNANEDLLSAQPMEIILHILSFLDDPKDILACSLVNRWIGLAADELKFKYAIHQLREIIGAQTDDLYLNDYCPAGFVRELRSTMIRLSQEVDYLKNVLPGVLERMPMGDSYNVLKALHKRLNAQKNGQFKNIYEMRKLGELLNDINTEIAKNQIAPHMTVYLKLRDLTRITPAFIDKHFAQLCGFTKLYLQDNFLITVPDKLLNSSQADVIKLNNNQLRQIPKRLFLMPKLAELHLQNNQIVEVPVAIRYSQKLKHLFLQHNHLSGLPSVMLEMSSLIRVGITHNHISEEEWAHIKHAKWSRARHDTEVAPDKPSWQTDVDVAQLTALFENFTLNERNDSRRLQDSCQEAAKLLMPKSKA